MKKSWVPGIVGIGVSGDEKHHPKHLNKLVTRIYLDY